MPEQIITMPFRIPNLYGGFAEGKGLARVSPSEVTLEFVVKENLLDVFKSGLKEIRIPRPEIGAVRLKRGWFGAKVQIRVKSMKWLQDLPGCDSGELTLHVARRDRALAEDFHQKLLADQNTVTGQLLPTPK